MVEERKRKPAIARPREEIVASGVPEEHRSVTPKRAMSAKLREARDKQAEVFKRAWAFARSSGRERVNAEDIKNARAEMGIPPKGVWDHEEAESLVGTTTKGFRIDSGTAVVRLTSGGTCEKGHYWDDGATVYKRHGKAMCPLCGSVIV